MNLLLDEMHAATVAAVLRDAGHDALAVTEREDQRSTADADLLAWAATADRVIVTENVRDFAVLADAWALEGRPHAGLVFTNPRRFGRATLAYPGVLIAALTGWLDDPPESMTSQIWWL